MIIETHGIVLGVVDGQEGWPHIQEERHELDAIQQVTGSSPDELFETLVGAAREACPNPNCCLMSRVTHGSQEIPDHTDDRDTSYDVSTLEVDVQFGGREGCSARAERLAEGFAKVAQTCIDLRGEIVSAEFSAREPFEAEARQIQFKAREEAARLETKGDSAAKVARAGISKKANRRIAYRRRRLAQAE
jgi:hypothetical protein